MRDINNYYRSYEKTPEQLNAEFINFINNCVKDKNFQSILDNAAMRKLSDGKYERFSLQCRFFYRHITYNVTSKS